ncbi:MAG: DUF885 domain-containing protein [Thermoplasmata archaeon]
MPRTPTTEANSPAERELADLEQQILEHGLLLNPAGAVNLGLHAYDGQLADLSPTALTAWTGKARELLASIRKLPERSLTPDRRLDHDRLQFMLESDLWGIEDARIFSTRPSTYLLQLDLTVYRSRAYAAKDERIGAMIRLLEATPKFLEQARRNLVGPLPQPFVTLGIDMASGLPAHYDECQEFAASGSGFVREFKKARAAAQESAQAFLQFLRDELTRARPEFAMGPHVFQKLLQVTEGLRTPWAVILDDGWRDLRRNQRRLAEVARAMAPTRSSAEAIRSLREDHPAPDQILDEARRAIAETRSLIVDRGFVSLPNEVPCRVEPMPPMDRAYAFAAIRSAGPFEPTADESIYYVNPLDPAWDAQRKSQWLAFFNRASLGIITAHETYPGHHVQFLHQNNKSLSSTARTYDSSFGEGWAHYTEQLVLEQGFRRGDPKVEVAQLREALLRDCRLIVTISMHAVNMSFADGEQLFIREGFTEPAIASLETRRCAVMPPYQYTLGKLAILRAREAYFREHPKGSLLEFHDRLLAQGCPPVGLLERIALQDVPPRV